jgi:transcriptional regulator with XRE-family HTH domain
MGVIFSGETQTAFESDMIPGMTAKRVALETTGDRIKWLRRRADLTQIELAALLGVSNVFVSDMENDVNPPLRRLVALARILNTTTDYLLLLTDNPSRPDDSFELATVYYSAEADEVAKIVDALEPGRRAFVLAHARMVARLDTPSAEVAGAVDDVALQLRAAGLVIGDDAMARIRAVLRRFADALAHPSATGTPGATGTPASVTAVNGGSR